MPVRSTGARLPDTPAAPHGTVSPLQLGPGEVRQPDQVIIITDASGTMHYNATFPSAKALTRTFVAAMPANNAPSRSGGGYDAALIGFGGNERINSPLAPFDRRALASTAAGLRVLGEVGGWGGRTPYRDVIGESARALTGKSATAALVIFSDGIPDDEMAALRAVRALEKAYSGNVCIHTVHTGDDAEGARFLNRLSKLTGCGSMRSAASVQNTSSFMRFTHDVFARAGRARTRARASGQRRTRRPGPKNAGRPATGQGRGESPEKNSINDRAASTNQEVNHEPRATGAATETGRFARSWARPAVL